MSDCYGNPNWPDAKVQRVIALRNGPLHKHLERLTAKAKEDANNARSIEERYRYLGQVEAFKRAHHLVGVACEAQGDGDREIYEQLLL